MLIVLLTVVIIFSLSLALSPRPRFLFMLTFNPALSQRSNPSPVSVPVVLHKELTFVFLFRLIIVYTSSFLFFHASNNTWEHRFCGGHSSRLGNLTRSETDTGAASIPLEGHIHPSPPASPSVTETPVHQNRPRVQEEEWHAGRGFYRLNICLTFKLSKSGPHANPSLSEETQYSHNLD